MKAHIHIPDILPQYLVSLITGMVQSVMSALRHDPYMPRQAHTPAVILAVVLSALVQAQQPTFRSGVDLIRLDVRVVGNDGTPVTDLTEDDFAVQVNGKACPIRALQFLDLSAADARSIETRYRDVSTNAASMRGRLTAIVIDENSLPEDSRPLMNGLSQYLRTLGPNDRTALVALPRPGLWKDFTSDSAELTALLLRSSSRTPLDVPSTIPVGASSIGANGGVAVGYGSVAVDRGEQSDLSLPASMTSALDPNRDIIYALEALARRLKTVEGPKTLILISSQLPEGIGLDDYHAFADSAAEARLTIYVVKPNTFVASASGNRSALTSPFFAPGGLDALAGMTGGVVLNAVAHATGVFDRIGRETSGGYVIGVEPPAGAPRNKPLNVTVRVKRSGLTIRSPKQVVAPAAGARKVSEQPKKILGDMLRDPRLATDLPLKVTSYTAQGADLHRLRAVIVAELDESPGDTGDVSWGFEVHDGARIVADAFEHTKAKDVSQHSLVTSANLAPGNYTMRLAVVDAQGRRASVEHPLAVGLHDLQDLQYSDVFVGEAANGHFRPRIVIDAASQQVVAFVELYTTDKLTFNRVSVEFALHAADGANRAATRVKAQPSATNPLKAMVQAALPLAHAGPGLYDVTANILVGGRPVGVTRREVVVGQER